MGSSMEEEQARHQETITVPLPQPQPQLNRNLGGFPVSTYPVKLSAAVLPVTGEKSMENLTLGPSNQSRTSPKLIRPIAIHPVPPSSNLAGFNLNQKATRVDVDLLPLPLKLSTPSSSSDEQSPQTPHSSAAFQAMSSGESSSIISVA